MATASAELPHSAQNRPMLGIAMKVASVCAFMAMATCVKLAGQLPPGQVVFFRAFAAILPIIAWLAWTNNLRGVWRTAHPFGHMARGVVGVISMGLGFYGLTRLPLPDSTAIGYARPLMTVIFGAIFLGEVVRIYRWGAVLVGLVGVLIISWPNLQAFRDGDLNNSEALGAAAVFASACIAGLAFVLVRKLIMTEKTPTIVLYFSVTATILALATIPFGWSPLNTMQVLCLVAAGGFGGLGQIMLTEGYRYADTSTIAPFEYTSVILSIVIGIVVFAEFPTGWTIAGSVIVIASGIFIIYREHRVGLERGKARPIVTPQG